MKGVRVCREDSVCQDKGRGGEEEGKKKKKKKRRGWRWRSGMRREERVRERGREGGRGSFLNTNSPRHREPLCFTQSRVCSPLFREPCTPSSHPLIQQYHPPFSLRFSFSNRVPVSFFHQPLPLSLSLPPPSLPPFSLTLSSSSDTILPSFLASFPCLAFPRASGSLPSSKRLPLPSAKEGNESETVQRCSHPTSLSLSLRFSPSLSLSLSPPRSLSVSLPPIPRLSHGHSFSLSLSSFHPTPLASSRSLPSPFYLSLALLRLSHPSSLFLPTVCQPSSCHPSNFSTSFTKIKINSSTTCPGTPLGTPPPSSATASLEH